jgi:ketosteroid isomerase-like protein
MNYSKSFLSLLGAFVLFTSACAPPAAPDTRAADEAAIREADAAWSKAAESRDLDAVVSYYTDDAQLLPPNEPIATTKAAIRASWAALLVPEMAVAWKVSKVEVAKAGDLAYVIGTYTLAIKPANDTGKLIEIWKKQADGKWKCVADTFNSDTPLPAPPPDKKK